MIIKPYSAIRDETFVAADYPAVQLFLKCNDTGTGLYDEVSGSTCTAASEATVTKDGTKVTIASAGTQIDFALPSTFTLDTSSYHLFLSVFEYATGAVVPLIKLTDGTDVLSIGSGSSVVSDGTSLSTSTHTGTSAATVYGGISQFKAGTTGEGRHTLCSVSAFDATTNCNVVNAAAGDIAAALTVNKLSFSHVVGGSVSCYMAAYIKLAAAPSDNFLRAMLAWMTKEASLGNKAIYPGLKGVS